MKIKIIYRKFSLFDKIQFAVWKFIQKVDSRDLKLWVITEFDVLFVKCQMLITIEPRGLPCEP